jgi:hypothetical protein
MFIFIKHISLGFWWYIICKVILTIPLPSIRQSIIISHFTDQYTRCALGILFDLFTIIYQLTWKKTTDLFCLQPYRNRISKVYCVLSSFTLDWYFREHALVTEACFLQLLFVLHIKHRQQTINPHCLFWSFPK